MALGSNLPGRFGSSDQLLDAALEALSAAGLQVVEASSSWRSAAWPDASAPEFRNRVAMVETDLNAHAALAALLGIERAFGRERGEANAARTLDLDLIDFDGQQIEAPGLILPHARARERLFVMGPLAEIAPGWRWPQTGESAAELALGASIGSDAAAPGSPSEP
ncbi:MAG: 2-amino-4-hydroxy-6-hydroxymethyldihydropteridine diphosphokinase [Proteobacteria bacterium]|nr:2-amino-4-hydroxy-6-hydroxymethyldihydropteridine diphosphokinase [Pseudomonadota bacterium]